MVLLFLQRAAAKLRLSLQQKPIPLCLQELWHALPKAYSQPWHHYRFLCVDLEFSDLNSTAGELLSIGWVEIYQKTIPLTSAEYYLVKNRHSVGQSACIHHIRDSDAAQGISAHRALQLFLHACRGKILIFHHARVDLNYLNKLCNSQFGCGLYLPYCDTFALERNKLLHRGEWLAPGALQLQRCRDRYGLPQYPPHHALADAIATGELFLAQASRKPANEALRGLI